jgi:hypothetical protein
VEVVDPTIADYARSPQDRRLAFIACTVVFHCIDYLEHPKRPANRRQKLRRESQAFELIDLIAHAFKHVETHIDRQMLSSHQVIQRPALAYNVSGAYGLSRYGDHIGGVTLANNVNVDILDALRSVRDVFVDKIQP